VTELRRYHSFGFDNNRWDGFRFRPDDIVISTPAKSGTTWMQMMCALLIFRQTTFDRPLTRISPWLENLTEPLDSVVRLLDEQQHRRFIKSHTPFDGLPRDPRVKYICVGRDPRDVAVSWTHHEANVNIEALVNLRIAAVGIDDLDELPPLRLPPTEPAERFWYWVDEPADRIVASSLASTVHHLATFWSERDDPDVALFHYGDMSRDLDGEMRRLAAFLEIDVPVAEWDDLVAAATFASMRRRPADLTPEVTTGFWNENDAFFRSGTSGQWREFIVTDDERSHYEARVAELADPELARWAHSGRASVQ
jgi:hypothetical protein